MKVFKLLAMVAVFVCVQALAQQTDAPKTVKMPYYPTYPSLNLAGKSQQEIELIQRGEYLAKAGDCISCHTETQKKPYGQPFAGGYAFKTPFGTFYTPNITMDKETGIGNWTEKQFIRGMHQGIQPGFSNNYPVFPYLYFTKIHTQDLRAIWAYLNAVPVVRRENTKNDVPFPLNLRIAQWGWKLLFFFSHEGSYKNDPTQSKEWNRGAYLVQGLGHCGMCHTPINALGAPKWKYFLRGNMVDGYFAPDITSDIMKDASIEEIEAVFTKYQMLKHAGAVEGPMAEVDHNSLIHLNQSDLHAIAVYLKTVKSEPLPVSKVSGTGSEVGKKVYEEHCAVCHAVGAAGAPKFGNAADWGSRIQKGMDVLYKNALQGINSMPMKGACVTCSDDEIKDAVNYMVDATKSASAAPVVTVKKLTLEDGKNLYEQHCSICHDNGWYKAPKIGDKEAWAPLMTYGMLPLLQHTVEGYNAMPPNGGCKSCTSEEVKAALVYLLQQSRPNDTYDFTDWLK